MTIFRSVALLLGPAFAFILATGLHSPSTTEALLMWTPCPENEAWECATLQVPMDYTDPGGATIELSVARLPAANQDAKIGPLFINFGGPGAPAIEVARDFGWAEALDPALLEVFDIVAVDPRGVATSTPIECNTYVQDWYGLDGTPDNDDEWAEIKNMARLIAEECAENGEILAHVGTRNVVHDFEQVRTALGADQVTFFGYSYGTTIGQVYADLYPESLRAVVLDAPYSFWSTASDGLLNQSLGFEGALDAFIAACDDDPECPLADFGGGAAAVDELLASVEEAPIPAPDSDRDTRVGEAVLGIAAALYSQDLWPVLADAIAAALDGDGTGLNDLADYYLFRDEDGNYPSDIFAYTAIVCIDQQTGDEDYFMAEAARHRAEVPRTGEDNLLKSALPCAYWPVPGDPLDGPVTAEDAPAVLVIATTGDPATPYEEGVLVSVSLETGVLLTHVGEGHTVYLSGNECIDSTVNDYLLDLTLPNDGAKCEPGATEPTGGEPPATPTPTATTEPPTATPTSPPPTATTEPPTATATPTQPPATATAVPPTATATPKPPAPPATGSGSITPAGRDWLLSLGAGLLALSAAGLILPRKR